ncbi:MAG: hypothetical protein U9R14_00535 [Patescibacteria group bacterium]|nr:hypothetical protein [Patescibacteria group bacterium]
MLIPKRISKKKLILYSIIMATMISGTGFLLYKNYKTVSIPDADFITIDAEVEDSMDFTEESGAMTNDADFMMPEADFETDINFAEEAGVRTNKVIKSLDISIFNNSKFKALKEIVFKEIEAEVGRKNPFENPFKEDDDDEQIDIS